MGQLVKLFDYISRYETDVFHYPSNFIRLKKKQWEYIKSLWEQGLWPDGKGGVEPIRAPDLKPKRTGFFKKLKNIRLYKEREFSLEEIQPTIESPFSFEEYQYLTTKKSIPTSLEDLKIYFLDEIFRVQILWASSTLTERSYVDSSFLRDDGLKYFLQRFPDTYLFFYHPIFLLKKAPVEAETFFITPSNIYIIAFLEEEDDAIYLASDDRFWEKRTSEGRRKFLNPTISLMRTENIIKQLLLANDAEMPITKIILSRNGLIDYPSVPFGLMIVDKKNYPEWFSGMRNMRAPIKHQQLKAIKAVLSKCKTQAVKRNDI